MAKQYVSDLKDGQPIDSIFVVRNKQIKQKKNGEPYLTLELVDKTGFIAANMWDNFDTAMQNNDFVKVVGVVGSFAGKPQGTLKEVKILKAQDINIADFLPTTDKNVDEMFKTIEQTIAAVQNEHLGKLLKAFFADKIFAAAYKKAPAALRMHNAYVGGLLEHVVDMLDIAEFICKKYPNIDKDLLRTAIILHDVAKIKEFQYETVIDYTNWGRLVGHNVMGIQMLDEKIKQFPDFPDELHMLLAHLILSHHGNPEWGSPVQPMTLEAVVLHHLDNLEAKVAGFNQFAEKNLQEGTPWTTKAFMFDNRHLYVPQNSEQ